MASHTQIFNTFQKAASIQDWLKDRASIISPMMRAAERENIRDGLIAEMVLNIRQYIDDIDTKVISGIIRHSVTKGALETSLRTELGCDESDDKSLLANLTHSRNRNLKTTAAQSFALHMALEAVLPPSLKAVHIKEREGKSPEDYIADTRAHVSNFTPEELLFVWKERQEKVDVKDIADNLYAIAQQCTPEKIECLLQHIRDNFYILDTKVLVENGWDAVQSILQASESGDFSKPEDMPAVKRFGQSLQKFFTVIEEGLAAASFDIPQNLQEQFRTAFDDNRLFHRAHQMKEAKHAIEGASTPIKTRLPIKLKRPSAI